MGQKDVRCTQGETTRRTILASGAGEVLPVICGETPQSASPLLGRTGIWGRQGRAMDQDSVTISMYTYDRMSQVGYAGNEATSASERTQS